MKKLAFFILLILSGQGLFSQASTCADAEPFCADETYVFDNTTGTTAEGGNNYDCLGQQPNPAWYYMEIDEAGTMAIEISQQDANGSGLDVDFILYGPYPDYATAMSYCGNMGTAGSGAGINEVIDCSYDPDPVEIAEFGNTQPGEVYVMMITNFSDQPGTITFEQIGGSASTDCGIVEPQCPTIGFNGYDYNFNTGEIEGQIPLDATVPCDYEYDIVFQAHNVNTAGGYITPGYYVEVFPTNANTDNEMYFYEDGNLLGGFYPGSPTGVVPQNSNFTGTVSYVSPSAGVIEVEFCNPSTGADMPYEVYDLHSGTLITSGTWTAGATGCQTISFPGSNITGLAEYACPTCPAGSFATFDWGGGYFSPEIAGPGSYDITYTFDPENGSDCETTHTHNITVTNPYDATWTNPGPFCITDVDVDLNDYLDASATTGGTWSGPGVTGSTFSPLGAGDGSHSVSYSVGINASCSDEITLDIEVNPQPDATANNTGPYCPGDNIELEGSTTTTGTDSYSWTGPNGYTSTDQNPTDATDAGDYDLVVTVDGCTSDPVTTTVTQHTVNTTINSNSPVCEGGEIHLEASGGNTYTWSGPNGFSATGSNQVIPNSTQADQGTYEVQIDDGNCVTSLDVFVDIDDGSNMNASVNNNGNICEGGNIEFEASGGGTYEWADPNGTIISTDDTHVIPNADLSHTGTYTVTIVGVSGCEGIINLDVEIEDAVNVEATVNNGGHICEGGNIEFTASGGDGYIWLDPSGTTISTDPTHTIPNSTAGDQGTYSVIISDSNTGCEGIIDLDVIIEETNPVDASVTNNGNICEGGNIEFEASGGPSYEWTDPNGTTISTDPTHTIPNSTPADNGTYTLIILDDNTGCEGIIDLDVTVTDEGATASVNNGGDICEGGNIEFEATGGTTYEWTNPNGDVISTDATHVIPDSDPSHTGTYTVSILGACEAVFDLEVIIEETNPVDASVNNAGDICEGGNIVFVASGGPSYEWTDPSGTTISNDPTHTIPNSTPADNGTYTVTILDDDTGCEGIIDLEVVIDETNPVDASVNNNGFICEGGNIEFEANGGVSYDWTGPDGFNTNEQNPVIENSTIANEGTYTVDITGNTGCQGLIDLDVEIDESNPVDASVNNDGNICEGGNIEFEANGGVSYDWSGPDGFDTNEQNPVIENSTIANEGTYTVDITGNTGCQGIINLDVEIDESNPVSAEVLNDAICYNGEIQFSADGGGTYDWTGPNDFEADISDPIVTDVTPDAEGTYTVTIIDTDGNNCEGIINLEVTLDGIPIADFDVDPYEGMAPLDIVTFNNSDGDGLTYEWDFGTDEFSSEYEPEYTYNDDGEYELTLVVTDLNGCTDTATVIINVIEIPDIEVPNIFSPNGDGVNDVFYVKNQGLESLNCQIYNRWGQLIYELIAPGSVWDGRTNAGVEASEGTYFYTLKAVAVNGKVFEETGTITLVR